MKKTRQRTDSEKIDSWLFHQSFMPTSDAEELTALRLENSLLGNPMSELMDTPPMPSTKGITIDSLNIDSSLKLAESILKEKA